MKYTLKIFIASFLFFSTLFANSNSNIKIKNTIDKPFNLNIPTLVIIVNFKNINVYDKENNLIINNDIEEFEKIYYKKIFFNVNKYFKKEFKQYNSSLVLKPLNKSKSIYTIKLPFNFTTNTNIYDYINKNILNKVYIKNKLNFKKLDINKDGYLDNKEFCLIYIYAANNKYITKDRYINKFSITSYSTGFSNSTTPFLDNLNILNYFHKGRYSVIAEYRYYKSLNQTHNNTGIIIHELLHSILDFKDTYVYKKHNKNDIMDEGQLNYNLKEVHIN